MDTLTRAFYTVFLLVCAAAVAAQLSPGDLSRPHAHLEGVQNCSQCHGGNRELVSDKCLACHSPIAAEQRTGRGLHAHSEYRACQDCHIEHQGKDAALIYWKDSESNFDHATTGFPLEGKHTSIPCRQCHLPKFIKNLSLPSGESIDSARTYLGLTRQCVGCHRDEHRGQFAKECTRCHSLTAWRPALGFDHASTTFALTGKHAVVTCAKCHPTLADRPIGDDLQYTKYANIEHTQCSACHSDFHAGKLGGNCSSCHITTGWQHVAADKFDHSKTRFALEGRHASVACEKCHRSGRSTTGLSFAVCMDCHADFHHGEFAKRPSHGACEECHTAAGFTPSRFLMAQHDQTDYPLKGAHRAVACIACHKTVRDVASVYRFSFTSTRCTICHSDPHHGQLDTVLVAGGCEACHTVDSWNQIRYDHSRTGFALEGKHVSVACGTCHAGDTSANAVASVRFSGTRKSCEACHVDKHRGQFAVNNQTDCARCHTAAAWIPSTFNHFTSSRFKLDGAHKQVACGKCHRAIDTGGNVYVEYKPLDISCASCHGTGDSGKAGRS